MALGIAHDLAARRIRRVAVVADRAQGRAVQECAVVQVQHEYRRVRRRGIDLLDGRHALFGELEFVPAAHHAHPLRIRGAVGLFLQHAQGVGQGGHAFPAQFQVVVQATADQVQVGVVQPRDDGAAVEVDHLAVRRAVAHHFVGVADGEEFAVLDGDRAGLGILAVDGVEAAVEEDEGGACLHECSGLHGPRAATVKKGAAGRAAGRRWPLRCAR
jgi:hypothetical protein